LNKTKVGIVSYLNTRPLLYGIQASPIASRIELVTDYPSNIAQALINDEIDLGLVPVSIIPLLKEHHIITDYCIGCDGEVASVALFSATPINRIEKVLLDYQSRTSVDLSRILMDKFWNIHPVIENGHASFEKRIIGKTAGVIIGDRALEQRKSSAYIYDLGKAWKDFTGLPFVFAAWISNKKLPQGFVEEFNEANAWGLQHLDAVVAELSSPNIDLMTYYTRYIDFSLNRAKMMGMEQFLALLEARTFTEDNIRFK